MCCEVGHTSYGVALDLYVVAQHLSNEGFESSELDDEQLILRCEKRECGVRTVPEISRTVDSEIAESGAGSALNLCVMAP